MTQIGNPELVLLIFSQYYWLWSFSLVTYAKSTYSQCRSEKSKILYETNVFLKSIRFSNNIIANIPDQPFLRATGVGIHESICIVQKKIQKKFFAKKNFSERTDRE
jgi:hypothetical protein